MLFALPDVLDEEKVLMRTFSSCFLVRVSMLNELIEFTEPYTQEEMEEVLAEKENNDFLEPKEVILVKNCYLYWNLYLMDLRLMQIWMKMMKNPRKKKRIIQI